MADLSDAAIAAIASVERTLEFSLRHKIAFRIGLTEDRDMHTKEIVHHFKTKYTDFTITQETDGYGLPFEVMVGIPTNLS